MQVCTPAPATSRCYDGMPLPKPGEIFEWILGFSEHLGRCALKFNEEQKSMREIGRKILRENPEVFAELAKR